MTMTLDAMALVLERIQLPFGWKIDMGFYTDESLEAHAFIRVSEPKGVCNVMKEPLPWSGRKWLLSKHMTVSEIVQTAWLATMTAIENEAREQFLYRGETVLNPHLDAEELVRVRKAGATDKRDMAKIMAHQDAMAAAGDIHITDDMIESYKQGLG